MQDRASEIKKAIMDSNADYFLLHEKSIDPNYTIDDVSLVAYSLIHKKYAIAKSLCSLGFSIDHGRRSAWNIATTKMQFDDDFDALEALLNGGMPVDRRSSSGLTPLMLAARSNLRSTRLLLEAGADSNFRGPNGWTPLFYAAAVDSSVCSIEDSIQIIGMLIKFRCDLSLKDNNGKTALDIASHEDACTPDLLNVLS